MPDYRVVAVQAAVTATVSAQSGLLINLAGCDLLVLVDRESMELTCIWHPKHICDNFCVLLPLRY